MGVGRERFASTAAAVWARLGARARSRVTLRKMLVHFSEFVFFFECQISPLDPHKLFLSSVVAI